MGYLSEVAFLGRGKMGLLRGSVLCAISALFLATAAPAQEGEGSLQVPGILYAGTSVTISYSNPEFEGQIIALAIRESSYEDPEYVLIELNEDGEGQNSWDVPKEWDQAIFNAQGVEQISRMIMELN